MRATGRSLQCWSVLNPTTSNKGSPYQSCIHVSQNLICVADHLRQF